MTISESDLEELLVALDRTREAWISGLLGVGPGLDIEQDADMTIFHPFGGEAGRGADLPDRQQAAAPTCRARWCLVPATSPADQGLAIPK
jgi:hypothetical protein